MTELPTIMASLELDDKQAQSVEVAEENRTENFSDIVCQMLRKQIRHTLHSREASKRRCSLKPTKLNTSQETGDVESYFMSKKINPIKVKTLATIYEEPKVNKNGVIAHTGPSKLRKINFNIISKEKIKKRKAKMKKVVCHKTSKKGRLSMEEFLPRLHRLIGSSPNGTDRNVTTSLVECEVE
jgi:hypothetical protein